MLVVRRIALQLSGSPIAYGGRLGLGTRLDDDSTTSGGHGGSDLRSPSNMRINRKVAQIARFFDSILI